MELSFDVINKISSSLGQRYFKIASFVAFLGLGTMIGIAAKNYLRFLIISFIVCFFTIKGLEYNHILSINWSVLNGLLGLPPKAGGAELLELFRTLCASHPIQTVGTVLGTILGFFWLG